MKRSIIVILLVMAGAINIRAQGIGPSALNATGGTALIGGSEFDWSVGEMTMVSTFTTPNVIITQGVLQPSDAMVSVPDTKSLSKLLKVFPNPATDIVNLQYTSSNDGTLSYRLLDMAGKEISSQRIVVASGHANGQVDVKPLAVATYMLEVTIVPENGAPETMSYKIQKLK